MHCKNCGSEVGQSKFCPDCGQPVNEMTYSNGTNYQSYANNGGYSNGANYQNFANNGAYSNTRNYEVGTFTLISAYKSMLKKYSKFDGRSRRSEYWLASIANSIIMSPFYIVYNTIINSGNIVEFDAPTTIIYIVLSLIIGGYSLALLVPTLALSCRRLHDTGKSGLLLLLNLIPCVGQIILFVFLVMDSHQVLTNMDLIQKVCSGYNKVILRG